MPYVVPLLYVWRDGEIWLDNSATRGHLRDDVDREPRVCSRWTNYPRPDQITIYAIAVDRLTGKETPLPAPEDRWPRAYRTRTPHERP